MVFSSLEFIFIFLPLFLAAYYLVSPKIKNFCVFAFSLVFYAYGTIENPLYVVLILFSILINYWVGRAIEEKSNDRRALFLIGLIYNFGWLFVFKYADFFAENLNFILARFPGNRRLPYANLILPIGISFYTFQEVSYLADVYRGKIKAERSLLRMGMYILMFPQLIAGPIVRYEDIQKELVSRQHTVRAFLNGGKLFIIGLGMKVLLANQIGRLWSDIQTIGYESISVPLAWMVIIAFSMQLYFDFYGYSLMAIGLGEMMGFHLPVNFAHPYLSLSMTEFWRRWHITLGNWFKEYVYIPLGGSRRGVGRTFFNLFVVWLLTGFWHGASWNFILWGLFLYFLIVLEKSGLSNVLNRFPAIGHGYMALMIPLSWMIFAITDCGQLAVYAGRLIGIGGEAVYALDYIKYGKIYGVLLGIGLLCCTDLPAKLYRKIQNRWMIIPVLIGIFALSVFLLYKGLDDPFLYFRF